MNMNGILDAQAASAATSAMQAITAQPLSVSLSIDADTQSWLTMILIASFGAWYVLKK